MIRIIEYQSTSGAQNRIPGELKDFSRVAGTEMRPNIITVIIFSFALVASQTEAVYSDGQSSMASLNSEYGIGVPVPLESTTFLPSDDEETLTPTVPLAKPSLPSATQVTGGFRVTSQSVIAGGFVKYRHPYRPNRIQIRGGKVWFDGILVFDAGPPIQPSSPQHASLPQSPSLQNSHNVDIGYLASPRLSIVKSTGTFDAHVSDPSSGSAIKLEQLAPRRLSFDSMDSLESGVTGGNNRAQSHYDHRVGTSAVRRFLASLPTDDEIRKAISYAASKQKSLTVRQLKSALRSRKLQRPRDDMY